jgi:glycosyltransferase involved in cell wall biosynthesis
MHETSFHPQTHFLGNLYRIAYCLPVFRPPNTTDTSILLQNLVMERLRSRGHILTLVAPKDLRDVICTTNPDDPKLVERTWSRTTWFNLTSKATWRAQQSLGIPYLNVFSNLCLYDACMQCLPGHDIVQERLGLYKMGVAMACRRLKLPYIAFFDSNEILEHDLFGTPLEGVLRWRATQAIRYNLESSVRVICVSNSAKAHLVGVWGVSEEKIAVFPNAVDVERFQPQPEFTSDIRRRFGIDDNPFIVFVGSFFPYQDVKGLLEAFAALLVDYPQVQLLLVGEGEQYTEMVKYASSLGLDSSVKFTGFLAHTEIPSILSAADIAVAPYTRIEDNNFLGSSMKLVEYLASGTAVIASDNGQINDVIRDGVNGLLVPAGNVNALVKALVKLINDPQYRQELGKQARLDVLREYSWNTYISRLESLYASVLEERFQYQSSKNGIGLK